VSHAAGEGERGRAGCVVVQAWSPLDLVPSPSRRFAPRPRGVALRWVTAEELERGVVVEWFDALGEDAEEESVLVAWVEPDWTHVDVDAFHARPGAGAIRVHAQRLSHPAARTECEPRAA